MPTPLPGGAAQMPAFADRSSDIYQRLLNERIIFLGTQVNDHSANLICAQLLLLATDDTALYIA